MLKVATHLAAVFCSTALLAVAPAGEGAPGPEAPPAAPAGEPEAPPKVVKPPKYQAGARRFVELGVPDVSKCKLVRLSGAAASPGENVWLVSEDSEKGLIRIIGASLREVELRKPAADAKREEGSWTYTKYEETDPAKAAKAFLNRRRKDELRYRAAERFFFAVELYTKGLTEEADELMDRIFETFEKADEYERRDRAEVVGLCYAALAGQLWQGALEGLGRDGNWKAAGDEALRLAERFGAWHGAERLKEIGKRLLATAERGPDYLPEAAKGLPEEMRKLLIGLRAPGAEPDGPKAARDSPRAALAAMGLKSFPALLAVAEDDTCCLEAGLAPADFEGPSRWRQSGDEPVRIPAPPTRGQIALQIMALTVPLGRDEGYRHRDRSGVEAQAFRDWYEQNRGLDAEGLALAHLQNGSPEQFAAAVSKLAAADKAKHREAIREAIRQFEGYQQITLLESFAKLDPEGARPVADELSKSEEEYLRKEAKRLLRKLKVSPPAPAEPGKTDPAGGEQPGAGAAGEPRAPPADAPGPETKAPGPKPGKEEKAQE